MYNNYPPQQPPQQQYPPQGYPPPGQPGFPPQHQGPPPQQGYGAPPPNGGYNAPPPQGYPPPQQGYPPPQQQQQGYPPPPQQGYGQYPPQQQGYGYGAPPQNLGYNAPPQGHHPPPPQAGYSPVPPTGFPSPAPPAGGAGASYYGAPPPHSTGMAPAGAVVPYNAPPSSYNAPPPNINVTADVQALHVALKSNTMLNNKKADVIKILAKRDGPTIDAIRRGHDAAHGDLVKRLIKEMSGDFETVLVATALGPGPESFVFWAHRAVAGGGTNESMLTEAVMCVPPHIMAGMKELYPRKYRKTLEAAVRGDLSLKTEDLFVAALDPPDPNAPATQQQAIADAAEFHTATAGRMGTSENTVIRLLTRRNAAQIAAMAAEYDRRHETGTAGTFVRRIDKEFSGHMKHAMLYIANGAVDAVGRDAKLLEDAMAGMGTKDDLLIMRVVRCHWNRIHMESVKNRYQQMYGRTLHSRVDGETRGRYCEMLLAMIA
ncbi:hypothetical protein EDC01DRAFT_203883 [Geopyxis carbonaria]|nr:hypothetical protein EDC01DRAFT_203883 [Geopyxis carbonaria]